MELTPDQLSAARSCGCVVTAATEDQVRRLSMQRRIFSVDGQPFVAARDGFFETHGTLAALIRKHRPGTTTDRNVDREAVSLPTQVTPIDTGSSTAIPGAVDAASAQPDASGPAPVKPRTPRAARPKPTSAPGADALSAATAPAPTAEDAATGVGTARIRATKARAARRRAGEPPKPRWMTAGKERRGRLK